MNANTQRTLMALAVAALFTTSMAYAGGDGEGGRHHSGDQHSTRVDISKHISLRSDVDLDGWIKVFGKVDVNAAAIAVSDANQSVHDNNVSNEGTLNVSGIGDKVGETISGNVGMNTAAGDNNAQANSAAIAAVGAAAADEDAAFGTNCESGCKKDKDPAGGMADAESFTSQSGHDNRTSNFAAGNIALIDGNAFDKASGNVGVNVASGDNNEQANSLAAATADNDVYATATATADQTSKDNCTDNMLALNAAGVLNSSLKGNAFSNASGNIGVNVAAGDGNLQSNSLAMAVAGGK